MMFRPTFCCSCGEKIERVEWRLWTSRRFCDLCATDHKHIDLVPFAAIGVGVFLSLFAVASYFRGPGESAGMTKLERNTNSAAKLKPPTLFSQASINANARNTASHGVNSNRNLTSQNIEQPVGNPNTSDNAVFYCGAITKKGTPCTRRVKSKGFCWQHAKSGQVAPTRF